MSESTVKIRILFLGHEPIVKSISRRVTESFIDFKPFVNYISNTLTSTDKYLLIIPNEYLENFLRDPVYGFPQVDVVFVYHNHNRSFQRQDNRYKKLVFCHQFEVLRGLDSGFINNIIDPLRSINREEISEFASTVIERVSLKRPVNSVQTVVQPSSGTYNTNTYQIELHFEDRLVASFNGRLVWKIDSIREKLSNARTKKCLSIYSPPFYTSPNGYRMCIRLFLNGDLDVRDNFISIFFVLMRGKNDDIDLKWPFSYKITFRLINQLSEEHDICESFWPDESSNCFEKPRASMNEGYGIKRFYSIADLEQNQDSYMRNDVMIIVTEVVFAENRPESLGSAGTGEKPSEELVQTESLDALLGI